MSFLFNCQQCGMLLEAQDDWDGLQTQCPGCKHSLHIVRPSANVNNTTPELHVVSGYGQSAPGYGKSAPGYGQSAPGYGQSAPGYGQPAPGYGQPAPCYRGSQQYCAMGIERFNRAYFESLSKIYFIFLKIGIPSFILGSILFTYLMMLDEISRSNAEGALSLLGLLGIVSSCCLIISEVYDFILLYRSWQIAKYYAAQRNITFFPNVTPAKAVAFMFIPFFNIYWIYVAHVDLEEGLDMLIGKKGSGIAFKFVIACWLSLIPYVGIIPAIFALIFAIRWFSETTKRSIELVESHTH